MTEVYGINGKPVQVDPAVFAALHPDDQKALQTPPSRETSIHLMYGPTFQIDEEFATHDEQYGKVWLVGFQDEPDVQRVSLFVTDWIKNPAAAIGKYPVFSRGKAGIYNWEIKVTVVRFNGERLV